MSGSSFWRCRGLQGRPYLYNVTPNLVSLMRTAQHSAIPNAELLRLFNQHPVFIRFLLASNRKTTFP